MALFPLALFSAAGASAGPIGGVAGYVSGFSSAVYKMAFPVETWTTLATGLSTSRLSLAGMANSGVAGYFAAGSVDDDPKNTVDKFAFPSDTRSSGGTTSDGARKSVGFSNSGTAGYVSLGRTFGVTYSAVVNKFAFPSDTRSTLGTGLSVARNGGAGINNKSVAGYVAGGNADVGGGLATTIDKFAFPGDSRSTLGTGLFAGVAESAGMSNNAVAGYVASGTESTGAVTRIAKFAFPSDTRSQLASGLSTARYALAGMANSGVAGYFAGGLGGSNAIVDRYAFTDDTRSVIASLPSGAYFNSGMANEAI
jgi:hypothetical protein